MLGLSGDADTIIGLSNPKIAIILSFVAVVAVAVNAITWTVEGIKLLTAPSLLNSFLNDRSSPTRRRVNLHVGVANRFIPNNEQTANAWNNGDQYTKEGYLQGGGRKYRQRAASITYALLGHAPHLAGVVAICKKLTRSILRFIGSYNFNSFCQIYTRFPTFILIFIRIVGNFCTLLHLDCVSKVPMVEWAPMRIRNEGLCLSVTSFEFKVLCGIECEDHTMQ